MAEKVLLVMVVEKRKSKHFFADDTEEMSELIRSAGGRLTTIVRAPIVRPSSSHFIHEGKVQELRGCIQRARMDLAVFNVDLSPVQSRNLEMDLGVRIVDRTGLILDIFARRAQSSEGRLQVELAQLNYLLPRLTGEGVLLSRLGGGIGTRGPGEQKLEINRRKIRDRISRIKGELENVRRHRELLRESRKRKAFKLIAVVGYTNAGKSTLLNALTGANALVEDKLFATLDPMTRSFRSSGNSRHVLLTDTVGFLRDLPHHLIEAFKATLEEVSEADALIHVIDASSDFADDQYREVNKLLDAMGAIGRPTALVLNKIDLLEAPVRAKIESRFEGAVAVSAKFGIHLDRLTEQMGKLLTSEPSDKKDSET